VLEEKVLGRWNVVRTKRRGIMATLGWGERGEKVEGETTQNWEKGAGRNWGGDASSYKKKT